MDSGATRRTMELECNWRISCWLVFVTCMWLVRVWQALRGGRHRAVYMNDDNSAPRSEKVIVVVLSSFVNFRL